MTNTGLITGLILRSAARSDVADLVDMAAEAFRDTYREIVDPRDMEDYVTTALTADYFLPHVEDPSSSLLLAMAGARLVGYALVTRSTPPTCVNRYSPVELARIYLRREAIGQGYGAALMRAVQSEARRLRADGIWLGVYDRNTRARAFYRRWGFIDVGIQQFMLGDKIYADPIMCAPVP
ncbi:MAG TPA: GNAT family N-acetyltransferase [Rhodanobacteraceae bacterium]|nr:GNAT family N-acetyltransferase [Rhodanobacteraceae bacterium]